MICKQLQECIEDKKTDCKWEKTCISYTDARTYVTCEQKRKKYQLTNDCNVKIRKYVLDGGIVRNEQDFVACDNLLIAYEEDAVRMIFVELKGKDFKHAIEQLKNNIQRVSTSSRQNKVYARIVHTQGVPRVRNSGNFVELERLVRSKGGNLKMHEWALEERLSHVDIKE